MDFREEPLERGSDKSSDKVSGEIFTRILKSFLWDFCRIFEDISVDFLLISDEFLSAVFGDSANFCTHLLESYGKNLQGSICVIGLQLLTPVLKPLACVEYGHWYIIFRSGEFLVFWWKITSWSFKIWIFCNFLVHCLIIFFRERDKSQ